MELYSSNKYKVSVTPALLKVGNASYPIRNIGSLRVDKKNTRWKKIVALSLLAFAVFCFAASAHGPDKNGDGSASSGIGLLSLLISLWVAYYAFRPMSELVVRTTGMEQRVLAIRNHAVVQQIASAIEVAMTR